MIPYEVIKDEKSDMTKIKCGYCSKIFKTVQQHEQHRCRKENNLNVECLSCKKPYNDHAMPNDAYCTKDLKETDEETRTSSDEKAETTAAEEPKAKSELYRCCVCHKDYPNMPYMIRHIKYHMTRKTGPSAFVEHCRDCDKGFTTKQQLTRHKAAHKDARPFKCEKCDKWFKTADSVKRHVYVHSDAKPFSCQICSKQFKAKHLMKRHEETHSDEKNYECPKCEKKFKARNSLRDHLLVHNGTRPYKCDQCEQSFYRRSHLATHKTVHSEVKPFSCKVCEKSFGRREHLKVHERIHSGEKPFKCTQCERSFNQQAGLQAHLVSHSDERPYTCLACKKTFKYQSQIKHHACKRDEIGPCMVDVHGLTTMEVTNSNSQSTTTPDNPEATTVSEQGQCNETAPANDAASTSNTEGTIIFIQIQNTSYTDESARSVDAVTMHDKNTDSRKNTVGETSTTPNTDVQVAISVAHANNEGRPEENRNIQSISDSSLRNIARTPKDVSGSRNMDAPRPDTANMQTRFVASSGNMDASRSRESVTCLHTTANAQARFTSTTSNMPVQTNVASFSATHTREPTNSQEVYVNTTNTLAGYASGQGNVTRTTAARQYIPADRAHIGTYDFVEGNRIPVNQVYMGTSHGHTLSEQSQNLAPPENLVWSHGGLTPLVSTVATTPEQSAMEILSDELHQRVPSGPMTVETSGRSHEILSGLPHLWNR